MKVTTTEKTITNTVYECKGCGHQTDTKIHTEMCPKHGEFCAHCRRGQDGITFPFVICPACDVALNVLCEDLYNWRDPCIHSAKPENLRKPWVVLSQKSDGDWIGSERP